MQQYQFIVYANQRPETLERLLRVMRHRGFSVQSLNVECADQQVKLTARVQSERDFSLLQYQLEKLYDVQAVERVSQ